MERKALAGIMLALLLTCMFTLAFNIQPVKASGTIYIRADGLIDPPTAPIQRDGDLYTLTGNINSDADGIVVQRNNMTLNGAGYTIQGTEEYPSFMGIGLSDRSNVTIKNTNVTRFVWGIQLYDSNYNSIVGNDITDNGMGISLSGCNNNNMYRNSITNNMFGIELLWCSNNTISENNIKANSDDGIYTSWVSNNSIFRNSITANNRFGIMLGGASNNTISENNIKANSYGIWLEVGSSDNSIYHNNFIDNNLQADIGSGMTGYSNVWDNGSSSGGNYWSNYTGVDLYWGPFQNLTGSDGIGDTPQIIDENNRDNYPLMSPYEYWSNPILGDINKDMDVDYRDLSQLATAYGSTPGKPNWNPNCDFNEDNKIDASDLSDLSRNYGKTYP